MVPRAAARAALASPPSALAPLIESARDADVEGFYLSPSSARSRRAPRGGGARARLALSGGRPAPRLHPLSRPRLRLLAGGAPGLPGEARPRMAAGRAGGRSRRLRAAPARRARGPRRPAGPRGARGCGGRWSSRRRWCPRRPPCAPRARTGRGGSPAGRSTPPSRWPTRRTPASSSGRSPRSAGASGQAALWAGIGAYRLDAPGVVEKVRAARAAGASGVVLFSSDSMDASGYDLLRARGVRRSRRGGRRSLRGRALRRLAAAALLAAAGWQASPPPPPAAASRRAVPVAERAAPRHRAGAVGQAHAGEDDAGRQGRADDRRARLRLVPPPAGRRAPGAASTRSAGCVSAAWWCSSPRSSRCPRS